jgi:hypothetical protein
MTIGHGYHGGIDADEGPQPRKTTSKAVVADHGVRT